MLRRGVHQHANAVGLAIAAAEITTGAAVERGRERRYHRPVRVPVGECVGQWDEVVAADLIERDHIGRLATDDDGGLGHRATAIAAGDSAVAEVQLQHPVWHARDRVDRGRSGQHRRGTSHARRNRQCPPKPSGQPPGPRSNHASTLIPAAASVRRQQAIDGQWFAARTAEDAQHGAGQLASLR
jgi:hypothetical protein